VADVLCVGKALGGGLPLSAALFVRRELEDVWKLGVEDVYTHTHTGNPLACAGALVVLEEVPKLFPRIDELARRFDAAGWGGRALLRVTDGDADDARHHGVLVIPVGDLIQAAPPFTISDDELDEAFARLRR
jgi:4-aminobutyrate aminotransferase-like enzyme